MLCLHFVSIIFLSNFFHSAPHMGYRVALAFHLHIITLCFYFVFVCFSSTGFSCQ